ncbi:Vesicle-associated membrane protein 724 [Tritrichomonas foetus]|uniref:Vesicle-associated membrane protein 724 n=1 Tax=Tritrichomonas foetus TaxID=1144522 RepID=A0A1J4KT17_9EUKA|nr:Vesicle-associated membrane protein 724 [Tritrichomonas foetus]|eukprot:OHT14258.1 Vesicle-associated membrane protein 724 [Tritrichomonas foetus]
MFYELTSESYDFETYQKITDKSGFLKKMKFYYGMVAYGTKVLAEYLQTTGNFKQIARELLEKMKFDGQRFAYDQGKYVFSGYSEMSKLVVIVLSDGTVEATSRFYCVQQIQQQFTSKYGSSFASFSEGSKTSDFGPEIKKILTVMENPSSSKIAEISKSLADTQAIMAENLSKALSRSEDLQVMESKAENIKNSAATFEREATSIRKQMCRQKWRWYLLGGGIILIVLIIIIAVVVSMLKR